MRYDNKIKLRMVYGIFVLLLGLGAFLLGVIKNAQNNADFQYFYYLVGTGGGLVGVGFGIIKKNFAAITDKKKRQAMLVEEKDERNILIAHKAGYITFVASTTVFYIVSLYLLFVGSTLFLPIMQICSVLIGLYLLFYFIVKKTN